MYLLGLKAKVISLEDTAPFINDRVTTVVAAAAVGTPWWLPYLQSVSQHAALWMPILGAAWLLLQIVSKIHDLRKSK